MKARLLKQILNTTRPTGDYGDYIAVGSGLSHQLINIDKKTLTLRYTLGESPDDKELLAIWNKLQELIESGEIIDIIEGADVIENPLPVFMINDDGEVCESVTDAYGYPNTDNNGVMLYNNTHFSNREDAIRFGIKEFELAIAFKRRMIDEHNKLVKGMQDSIERYESIVSNLQSQL